MSDLGEPIKPSLAEVRTSEDYAILTNPEQREVIKRRGIDMINDSIEADMVIFLDKSARPLSYLYRKLFPVIKPDKPMPKIKFLNIGSEKVTHLQSYAPDEPPRKTETGSRLGVWTAPQVNPVLDDIHTIEDLNYFFGEENVDQLIRVLEVEDKPKKRLIIDDVEVSGETKAVAEKIIAAADRKNGSYAFFTFLKTPEDKEAFKVPDSMGVTNSAALPWHGDDGLVEDIAKDDYYLFEVDPYFITRRTSNSSGRDYSLQVRKELGMLVDEIKEKAA